MKPKIKGKLRNFKFVGPADKLLEDEKIRTGRTYTEITEGALLYISTLRPSARDEVHSIARRALEKWATRQSPGLAPEPVK